MISQWLAVISEYTGNLGSGAELGQVELEARQSPGRGQTQMPGCRRGLLRSHLVRFLLQGNPDTLPIAWSTIPYT